MKIKELKVLNLTVTKQCNMKCKHCGATGCSTSKEKQELTTDEYNSVINQAAELGCKNIVVAGGEPFLRKDIFDILKIAESRNIWCSILSNGSLIDKEIADKLKDLKNISYVRISLDYADNKKMEDFRGVERIIDKAVEAIKMLVNNKIRVGIGMTLMPDNFHELEKVLSLSIDSGADFFRAVPIVPIGRAQNITIEKNFYVDALTNVLLANAKVQPNYFGTNFLPDDLGKLYTDIIIKCPGGDYIASLSADGYLTRCSLSRDIISQKSVREERLSKLWEILTNRKAYENKAFCRLGHEKCTKCELLEKCMGGCYIEKEARNYEYFEHPPICIKDIWINVMSKLEQNKSIRRTVNNILCFYDSNKMFNVPMCLRSAPLWWFPLKKITN